jgi:prepilin-type processing-associated H-X9-DG protein
MAPNTYSCIDGTGGHLLSGAWTAQSRHPGGVNVCFGDGSVHFIKQSISLPVWWGIGTKAGGEVISSDSFLEEATVTGTVKIRGKLVEGGELNFNAVNPNRRVDTRKAAIGKDGAYTVKAYLGLNIVTVTPPKPRNKQEGKEFFGVNYEEKSVTVTSGENKADLDILPP